MHNSRTTRRLHTCDVYISALLVISMFKQWWTNFSVADASIIMLANSVQFVSVCSHTAVYYLLFAGSSLIRVEQPTRETRQYPSLWVSVQIHASYEPSWRSHLLPIDLISCRNVFFLSSKVTIVCVLSTSVPMQIVLWIFGGGR
jgi:hypothetical protein